MGRTTRALVLTLGVSLASFVAVAANAVPASAAASRCLTHAPSSTADYQSIADSRDAKFGVGDITSVVGLPDGRRLFAFGDTAYFNVNANGTPGPMQGFGTNSAWVQSGKCFMLLDRDFPDSKSWVMPPQRDASFYWPGASVVVGPRLYVFMQRLVRSGAFGRSVGAVVAQFDLPSLKLARLTPIPWSAKRVYGIGGVYSEGYLYAYASQLRTCAFCFASDMYVARVPESQVMLPNAWQYRAGSRWTNDFNAAQPVLNAAVSNTDVQPYGNGFLLVTKTISIIGPPVEAWWAPDPAGPWQDLGTVYSVPEPPPSRLPGFVYQQAYTYNPVVLANTRLANGQLLGSYNVNTFDPADAQHDGRMLGPRFFSIPLPSPPSSAPHAVAVPGPSGWTPTLGVDSTGRVRTVDGGVGFDHSVTTHAVAVARTPSGRGGWVASADGGVFAYGDAHFYGSMGGVKLNQPIVGMAATLTGRGYWLVARDGGIFSFGDARFYGSTGNIHLNKPIVAMAASPTSRGYWFVASDGGIFTFGDARFVGSTGGAPPYFPITGMAATPDGRGYWLVTLAGQVFGFGDARSNGDAALPLQAPVIGIVAAPGGYRLVDSSGNVWVRAATSGHKAIKRVRPLVAAG